MSFRSKNAGGCSRRRFCNRRESELDAREQQLRGLEVGEWRAPPPRRHTAPGGAHPGSSPPGLGGDDIAPRRYSYAAGQKISPGAEVCSVCLLSAVETNAQLVPGLLSWSEEKRRRGDLMCGPPLQSWDSPIGGGLAGSGRPGPQRNASLSSNSGGFASVFSASGSGAQGGGFERSSAVLTPIAFQLRSTLSEVRPVPQKQPRYAARLQAPLRLPATAVCFGGTRSLLRTF